MVGIHEPLIDAGMWEQVQLWLAVRGRVNRNSHRYKHILRGLVRCACGMAMTGEFHDDGRNAYLRCVSTANARYKSCGRCGPRIDNIIGQLESEILPTIAIPDNQLDIIREDLRGLMHKDHHALEAEIHILREQEAKIDSRLKTLLDMRLDGEITKAEYQAKKAELDLDKAKLIQQLDRNAAVLSRGEKELNEALALANKLLGLWGEADDEERWKILKTIFVRFVVDDGSIVDVELHPLYNFLMRWKPEDKEAPMASLMASSDTIEVYSNPTSRT